MIHEPTPTTSHEDLAFAGLAEQARLVRSGEVSSRDLVEMSLERIERLDPKLNAFRCVLADAARAAAGAADARCEAGERAPLLGVPVAVKDNVDMTGELTCHGTGANETPATSDGEAVRRLRAAGAVIVGKTNLPELAMWGQFTESQTYGATRNPWNPERASGGSSGGSAAAVAAGMVAGALGSDGGASIRVPAAMCGIVGIKPQRGRVPLAPDKDHWHGLTHFGPLARSVGDAALLLDVLGDSGTELSGAAAREPGRMRIGIAMKPGLPGIRLTKPWREAVERTAELLRSLGHEVIKAQPRYGALLPVIMPRYLAGVADDAARLDKPELLERRSRRMAGAGRRLHGRPLRRALRREPKVAARLNKPFQSVHALIMPTVAQAAEPVGASQPRGAVRTFYRGGPYVAYTAPWNYTGQPAAAIPAGFDDDGMPLSVQVVVRPGEDAALVSLAAQLERARGASARRPAVS
jgi:amidase